MCDKRIPLRGYQKRSREKNVTETGDNGNAMLPNKSLNFKDTRHKISVPLAMSTNLQKKSSKLVKKKEKNNSWEDVGPRSA